MLPSLFLSHGSPMMALANPATDPYIARLRDLWKTLQRPRAILMISAHWFTGGKFVSISKKPEMIYDFYGFPGELSRIVYGAPGFQQWEAILRECIPDISWISVERGLDHGAWTPLMHAFPDADIPIFSISVDKNDTAEAHFRLGQALRPLREQGIMIVASGNIIHDLRSVDFSGSMGTRPFDFAEKFDTVFKQSVEKGEYDTLFHPHRIPGGLSSVPTPDHYLPALTILGTQYPEERVEWIFEGFELGSIGRRAFGVGI